MKVSEIFEVANRFEKLANDPKAKVRNRGDCVFPAEHRNVTDDRDHFPIGNENQARNALARASQYSSVPSWWNGSLSSLISAIRRNVHSKYPSIKLTDKSKNSGKG